MKSHQNLYTILNQELLSGDDVVAINNFLKKLHAKEEIAELKSLQIPAESLTIILAVLSSKLIRRLLDFDEINQLNEQGKFYELSMLDAVQKAILETSSKTELENAITALSSLIEIAKAK